MSSITDEMGQKATKCGPGYPSPKDAMNGPKEKLLYVVTVQPNLDEPHGDYLSTIDVDPESPTYSQIIHRTYTNHTSEELHHSGWNTCSSCYKVDEKCCKGDVPVRNKLILPCLKSSAVYIMDVGTDPRAPQIDKRIGPEVLLSNNVCSPHTTHCLADGRVMISTLGDRDGNAKGDFILFDGKTFECLGTWTKSETAKCGYDFWYQPYFNRMVASEWSAPKMFKSGFNNEDFSNINEYGRRLNFYNWKEQELVQTIELGHDGLAPLEIRFMHDPKRNEGFVGCCISSKIKRFYIPEGNDKYVVENVIEVPNKIIKGYRSSILGGCITDIVLSLDDRYLYFNNWLHGDIRQYDITDPAKPKLVGQIYLSGVLNNPEVEIIEDHEWKERPKPVVIKGKQLHGGPQMTQLSLDGKRLYVSSSLFSVWDKIFYPEMIEHGGWIVQLDVDTEKGGLTLNENFLIDFGDEPFGPALPHEMRYPGGDCTSDIWLAEDN